MASGYDNTITAEGTLLGYWTLGDASGTTMTHLGAGSDGTYSATGVTLGQTGIGDGETAATFTGTTIGSASAAINLSAQNIITLEYWLSKAAFSNDDKISAEFTVNSNSNTGSFLINPDSSNTAAYYFDVSEGDSTHYNLCNIVRPSTSVFHQYAFVLDRTTAGTMIAYVDGAAVTVTPGTGVNATAVGGNFANDTLYLMARAGTSLFCPGTLAKVAIYSGTLSSASVAAHFAAATIAADNIAVIN